MNLKQFVEISKCLSNVTRVEIFEWLKEPCNNFPANTTQIPNSDDVCVSFIHEKIQLAKAKGAYVATTASERNHEFLKAQIRLIRIYCISNLNFLGSLGGLSILLQD